MRKIRLWIPNGSWCRSNGSSQTAAIPAPLVLLPIRSPAGNQILFHTLFWAFWVTRVLSNTTYHFRCLPPVGKQTIRAKIGGRKVSLGRIYLTWPLSVWKSSSTPSATFLISSFHCGWCQSPILPGEKALWCCFKFEESNLLFDNSLEATDSL